MQASPTGHESSALTMSSEIRRFALRKLHPLIHRRLPEANLAPCQREKCEIPERAAELSRD